MKLHSLVITAFGPFAGTETIDMDALTASGLFLLEGPTGAGKSTVLDAVTFALYGRTSGSGSSADRLHSDFADPGSTPRVVLDFSVGDERLRVDRVPQHERPKKVGQGTTTQAESVHLERWADEGWESLSSNKAEVGSMLTDRLGLSADQFTQVVLLPQGEFMRFLRADDDARRSVLTTIFGTWLYDRVTAELETKRAEAGRARDAAAGKVREVLAAAAQAAGIEGDELERLMALPDAERPVALDEVALSLQEAATAATARLTGAEAQLATAEAVRSSAQAAADLHRDLAEAVRRQVAHETGRAAHEARAEELRLAQSAAPVAALLGPLDEAESHVREARAALSVAAPDLDATAADGTGDVERARLARVDEKAADGLGPLVEREVALEAARAGIVAIEAEVSELGGSLAALVAEAEGLPARLQAAEDARTAASSFAAGLPAAQEAARAAGDRRVAAEELEELAPRLARARAAHEDATALRQQRVTAHLGLWQRHLDGIASTLAGQLAEGVPCLVCGSTTHPMPAEPAADAVSAADVEAAKSLADTAEIDEHTCAQTFHDLDRQRAGLVGRAGADDLPTLRAAASEADLAVAAALAAQEALPGLASAHADVTLRQRELAGLITTATASEAAAAQKLDGLRTDLQAHEQAVAAGRDGHPSVADRQRALQASAGHHQAAADALASLRRALQSRDALLGSTEAEARARGFADLEVARAARRSPAESAAIEATVTAWATTATTLAGAVGDARFADLDPLDAVPARQRLDDADTARTAADDARESALTSDAAAHQRLDGFTRRRADLTAAEQARTQVHDDTAAVVRLAGLAKGTTSALRMSLTTYVLRHWFEQVVQAANLRLRTMSNGRFVLERVDEAEKGERRTGLSLKVIDRHTGESRSPKSLSGGETFYTSLALALGLADVVRAEAGGVELDTLFIDEGFGTLDSETLDQVMSVIDELRNGGRAVGIVSHVADLKEQIAERLEIRRRDDGSSYTTVVA